MDGFSITSGGTIVVGVTDLVEFPIVNCKSSLLTTEVLPKRYLPTICVPESGSKNHPFFVRSLGNLSPSFSNVGTSSLP